MHETVAWKPHVMTFDDTTFGGSTFLVVSPDMLALIRRERPAAITECAVTVPPTMALDGVPMEVGPSMPGEVIIGMRPATKADSSFVIDHRGRQMVLVWSHGVP
jgi:hypothetical protein